ncbi:MAG: segregation/condensation protein A [Methanomicrobiales archaeon]
MNEDPVEILVGLAEKGEIDPWRIDIVEVTDRFLDELDRRKELNLRVSGRTLFFASLLLRMKSEQLGEYVEDTGEIPDDDEWEGIDLDEDGEYDLAQGEPIARLEREIRRRISRKRLRTQPVTLYELISQLKTAEREDRRRRRRRTPPPEEEIEPLDAGSLAHEEGYDRLALRVLEQFRTGAHGEGRLSLGDLSASIGWDARDVYISLLYLMLDERVCLWQESFFGDIYIDPAGSS